MAQFGGRGSIYNTLFGAGATARYELDLFGRLSRAKEADVAGLLASVQNQRTVLQTVVADVVRTWLEVRTLECQLEYNRQTIDSFERSLLLVEERYFRGVSPPVDVYLARQNLLTAKALKPAWIQQLNTARRRLEILAGRYPAGLAAGPPPGEDCHCTPPRKLPPVPPGLPSKLVDRRPDLLAAEAQLHAATARIGSAKALLYPRITLTADGGYRSSEFDDLFKWSTSIWSVAGNLVAPLINRGAQKSQIQAAEARTLQALAAYQATVLNAFREVESSLEAERTQRERRDMLTGAVAQARRALVLAEERYARGLDNYLLTLDTQRRLYQTEAELIETERIVRTARVNLILALGGTWDEQVVAAENQQVSLAPPAEDQP
jgi:multidrug efflux system outer membrane protein